MVLTWFLMVPTLTWFLMVLTLFLMVLAWLLMVLTWSLMIWHAVANQIRAVYNSVQICRPIRYWRHCVAHALRLLEKLRSAGAAVAMRVVCGLRTAALQLRLRMRLRMRCVSLDFSRETQPECNRNATGMQPCAEATHAQRNVAKIAREIKHYAYWNLPPKLLVSSRSCVMLGFSSDFGCVALRLHCACVPLRMRCSCICACVASPLRNQEQSQRMRSRSCNAAVRSPHTTRIATAAPAFLNFSTSRNACATQWRQ